MTPPTTCGLSRASAHHTEPYAVIFKPRARSLSPDPRFPKNGYCGQRRSADLSLGTIGSHAAIVSPAARSPRHRQRRTRLRASISRRRDCVGRCEAQTGRSEARARQPDRSSLGQRHGDERRDDDGRQQADHGEPPSSPWGDQRTGFPSRRLVGRASSRETPHRVRDPELDGTSVRAVADGSRCPHG
jgi:hypothetical protein